MVNNTVPAPMNARDALATSGVAADKAIIALILLRRERQPGTTGVGPNRDDLPLFQELVDKWSQGQGGDKETVMRARARATKYGRQLSQSIYWPLVKNPEIDRAMMIEGGQRTLQKHRAERELKQFLQDDAAYGNW